jgi:hypothetical protein
MHRLIAGWSTDLARAPIAPKTDCDILASEPRRPTAPEGNPQRNLGLSRGNRATAKASAGGARTQVHTRFVGRGGGDRDGRIIDRESGNEVRVIDRESGNEVRADEGKLDASSLTGLARGSGLRPQTDGRFLSRLGPERDAPLDGRPLIPRIL